MLMPKNPAEIAILPRQTRRAILSLPGCPRLLQGAQWGFARSSQNRPCAEYTARRDFLRLARFNVFFKVVVVVPCLVDRRTELLRDRERYAEIVRPNDDRKYTAPEGKFEVADGEKPSHDPEPARKGMVVVTAMFPRATAVLPASLMSAHSFCSIFHN